MSVGGKGKGNIISAFKRGGNEVRTMNDEDLLIESIFGNDTTKSMYELSTYLVDNYKLDGIEIALGTRLNYHSNHKFRLSPSFSIIKPNELYTYRLNFSQNYRTPNIKELYYNYENHGGGFPIIGNEELSPSISNYYSFSMESRTNNNSIELYFNNIYNMIYNKFVIENDQVVYKYHNYKEVDLYGLNVSSTVKPIKKLSIQSVYSYTGALSTYEDVLDGISAHSLNARMKYKFLNRLTLYFSSKYNSSKTVDISLEDQDNLRTELVLPSYTIHNISAIYKIKSNSQIKIGIKNILDYTDSNEVSPDFLSSYEPGRRFFISININLERNI